MREEMDTSPQPLGERRRCVHTTALLRSRPRGRGKAEYLSRYGDKYIAQESGVKQKGRKQGSCEEFAGGRLTDDLEGVIPPVLPAANRREPASLLQMSGDVDGKRCLPRTPAGFAESAAAFVRKSFPSYHLGHLSCHPIDATPLPV
jgi:hypothetical protein